MLFNELPTILTVLTTLLASLYVLALSGAAWVFFTLSRD